jgi:hypothetical protein
MFNNFIIALTLLAFLFSTIEGKWNYDEYKCAICIPVFDKMIETGDSNFHTTCASIFPEDMCSKFNLPSSHVDKIPHFTARDHCARLGVCPFTPDYPVVEGTDSGAIDVRVTKALGSKGYNKVRLSVISNSSVSSSYFSYSQPFKYRWTNKYLNTGIVDVVPGQASHFYVGGKDISITIPKENAGVRGIILADPCFTNEWIVCVYKDKYNTFNHVTELLNAMTATNEIGFWQILGDNFYDQVGDASSSWFSALSDQTKATIFAAAPGNHDFWVNASPKLAVPKDQYGNGFLQFYGQDVLASKSTSNNAPYDFSVDPDGSYGNARGENLPIASNYFFYNKVGNIAFIGFSGAHSWTTMTPQFEEACSWAASANPDVVLLLGHWNQDGDGCDSTSTVPNVYVQMMKLSSCAPISDKLRYFEGHKHCNYVTETNKGFMVGGLGMSDKDCMGSFGFPVVDTTNGRFQVYYFPIAHGDDYDNYDKTLSCIKTNGVAGCYYLAEKWADVPL